jgi:hypothetical protein
MNIFDAARKARQAVLPSLREGYFRNLAINSVNIAGIFSADIPTPIDGKMFNPQKVEISPPTGAIVRVLSNIPESKLPSNHWLG